MKLSDTQRVILSKASQHEYNLAVPPPKLPAAAAAAVARALLKNDLVIATQARTYNAAEAWQIDGVPHLLRITDEGLRAIGVDPDEERPGEPDACGLEGSVPGTPAEEPHQGAEVPAGDDTTTEGAEAAQPEPDAEDEGEEDDRPRHEQLGVDESRIYGDEGDATGEDARTRRGLRAATVAFLAAWDACPAQDATDNPISRAVEGLRAALAGKPARQPRAPRPPGEPRAPREGSKQEAVLALLRRPEGASGPQMAEATGWAPHTIRGFLAGLKKKGIDVQVKERVRMVGPNKEGAKGSYTVYQVAG